MTWPRQIPGMLPGAVRVDMDDEAGAAYILISDAPVHHTVERVSNRVLIDKDAEGNTVGVELLLARPPQRFGTRQWWRLGISRRWKRS